MTRLTWTSGDKASPWREVDSDSFSLRSTWLRTLRLIGLINDVAHGENSPPVVLDASGVSGKGCPLGVPAGQEMRVPTQYKATATGEAYLAICPVFIPEGEDGFRVEMDHAPTTYSHDLKFQVLSTVDMSIIAEASPSFLMAANTSPAFAMFSGLAEGVHIFAVRGYLANGASGTAGALRVYFPRLGAYPAAAPDRAVTDNVSLSTQDGAASAVIADIVDLDESWVVEGTPIDARSLDAAARNLATLDEEVLARPGMGANASYTLVSSTGDVDPADDAFLSGSRSVYSAEPVFDFPLMIYAGGVCPVDGGTGDTAGLGNVTDGAFAPGGAANASVSVAVLSPARFPDLAASGGGVALRIALLWYSPDASVSGATSTPTTWCRALNSAGTVLATGTQAHTSWGNPSGNWHTSSVDLADWPEDDEGMITIGYDVSLGNLKAITGASLRLAGACAYMVKT